MLNHGVGRLISRVSFLKSMKRRISCGCLDIIGYSRGCFEAAGKLQGNAIRLEMQNGSNGQMS